jgi:(2S)-methylsuccinyl-CoA dehydrogenase
MQNPGATMAHDGNSLGLGHDLLAQTHAAAAEVDTLFHTARENLRIRVTVGGKVSAAALEEHQFAAHSLAWLATYAQALRQMQGG